MSFFALETEVQHEVGNPHCPECCEEFPVPCRCGGLIHAVEGEPDIEGDVVLVTECDQCGRSLEQSEEEA
jgi:hypothetical protein